MEVILSWFYYLKIEKFEAQDFRSKLTKMTGNLFYIT